MTDLVCGPLPQLNTSPSVLTTLYNAFSDFNEESVFVKILKIDPYATSISVRLSYYGVRPLRGYILVYTRNETKGLSACLGFIGVTKPGDYSIRLDPSIILVENCDMIRTVADYHDWYDDPRFLHNNLI